MEFWSTVVESPFAWGFASGLLITGFIWKAAFQEKRQLKRELKRLESELKDFQGHLNVQLKIHSTGNQSIQDELEQLRKQNEILRVNQVTLQQKPGRGEQRQLHLYELAIRSMREQAPGFAPVWEQALRQSEAELVAADTGLKKLVRRVLPGFSGSSSLGVSDTSDL